MDMSIIIAIVVVFSVVVLGIATMMRRDPIQGLSNNANAVGIAKDGFAYGAKGDGVYFVDTRPRTATTTAQGQPAPAVFNNYNYGGAPVPGQAPAGNQAQPPAQGQGQQPNQGNQPRNPAPATPAAQPPAKKTVRPVRPIADTI